MKILWFREFFGEISVMLNYTIVRIGTDGKASF